LRRIFGPKRDEVTGGWRKLHKEELHNLYSSPGIIRMTESRKMRLAGDVARTERRGMRDTGEKVRRKDTTRKTTTYS
jgi:hypothetical protein